MSEIGWEVSFNVHIVRFPKSKKKDSAEKAILKVKMANKL